ncbi:MAG: lipopolysaccharide biosynthesis protein [Akkermansia sp.]|nr:lipopolysaccharide biosynthesis protein [Akkermansia sp.]MBQ8376360.1 lipopolysaccharide biosynthesis protein [Akkermansia sp.]
MSHLKKETLSGMKWGMLQKLTMQPLQLVYGMVLARLITPEEMGIVGLTAIFFAIAGQLASAGFGAALVRKIDRTEADCSTMFWFNLGMSFLMGLILFLLAPWFAGFYNQAELLWLTRVSAIMMFVNSSTSVHWTLYQCRRDFKTPAIVSCITSIAGMPLCLTLAWLDWGVWALMWQGVFTSLLSLLIVWCISPWKPHFIFSKASFLEMFSFGSKLAYGGVLHVFYQNIRTFIIGKFYSPAQLGLYTRGTHITNVLPLTINGVLGNIIYPILSTIQNDDERLTRAYRMYIKTSTLVIAWICMCLLAMGEPLVRLMYGENWLGCVIFVQIASLGVAVDHICAINVNFLLVKGRSDLLLRLEVIKKSISIAMLFYAATISVEAICWASVIYIHIAIFINTYYTGKYLGLTWWRQQKDYMPYVIGSAISCIPAWFISQTEWPALVQLSIGGFSAFVLYFGALHRLKDAAYSELYSTVRSSKWGKWLPVL